MKIEEYKKLANKPKRKNDQQEYKLHIDVVAHLKSAFPQVLFTHAGKSKGKLDAIFKKKMGYRAGTPDLLLWWACDPTLWQRIIRFLGFNPHLIHGGTIELKAPGGSMSDDQETFDYLFTRMGGLFACCKSKAEVHACLVGWGLKPLHDAGMEPDLRTKEQKYKDAMDFYKPTKKD